MTLRLDGHWHSPSRSSCSSQPSSSSTFTRTSTTNIGGDTMPTIYLVVSPGYEYSVYGAFSSRGKAERTIAAYHETHLEIEEYEIDGIPLPPKGTRPFAVTMNRAGKIKHVGSAVLGYPLVDLWKAHGTEPMATLTVFARDKKHAKQLAEQKRLSLISNGEWPE